MKQKKWKKITISELKIEDLIKTIQVNATSNNKPCKSSYSVAKIYCGNADIEYVLRD